MSWSVNEVAALATRAARGAGAPIFPANLFGEICAQHLSARRDTEELLSCLEALPTGPLIQVLGLSIALEACARQPVRLPAHVPDAFLSSFAESRNYVVRLDLNERTATAYTTEFVLGHKKRVEGYDTFIALLKQLAEKTYVPENEMSRAAGAGAGEIDND